MYVSFLKSHVLYNHFIAILEKKLLYLVSKERVLEFLGRKLVVRKAAGRLAMFTFKELCARPLSAADYLELCTHFDTLFIKDVPQMTILSRTEARRFITMVDTLYDHKIKIICTAEVGPGELFLAKPIDVEESTEFHELMDDLSVEAVSVFVSHSHTQRQTDSVCVCVCVFVCVSVCLSVCLTQ